MLFKIKYCRFKKMFRVCHFQILIFNLISLSLFLGHQALKSWSRRKAHVEKHRNGNRLDRPLVGYSSLIHYDLNV